MAGCVSFSDRGEPAYIDYNVALPSSHTGRRIVSLGLGLKKDDWTKFAMTAGNDPASESHSSSPTDIYKELLGMQTMRRDNVSAKGSIASGGSKAQGTEGQASESDSSLTSMIKSAAERGHQILPLRTWDGRFIPSEVTPQKNPEPRLLIVEVYGISSFLGRYGMGRTVNTFTLLPGEETRITLKTWRSTQETREEASSIVDSHDEKAASRFSDSMQSETSEKRTESSKETWEVEVEASASWGVYSADVSAGASGEYQSGRESFSRSASEATKEHCAEASQKRETSVSTSSKSSVEAGEETTTERIIKNVNMRRTLNFVFRELNQEYITKVHLKDIRIAFTNGRTGSYREAPLSGMRKLLASVLKQDKVADVAQGILKNIATVFDHSDKPQLVLESVVLTDDMQDWKTTDARMVQGEYPPPGDLNFYRFKRGSIGQDQGHAVDGVVVKEDVIIMRTDGICVEALVGESDALDNYAMEVQAAAAEARTLANRREQLALDTLAAIDDAQERAKAFALMFAPEKKDG